MLDERWGPDEQALADGLRGLLAGCCPPPVVRAAEAAADGRDPALDDHLDRFGLWELPPEPGLLAVASWELGRALAPIHHPERAAPAAVGLQGAVWAERGWCPAVALDPAGLGPKGLDRPGIGPVGVGPGGALVRGEASGKSRRTAAGDLLAPVTFTGDEVAPPEVADRCRRLVRLLTAARAVGAAEGVASLAVTYVKERHQFGRPIGAFQAVAHRLADVAVAVDGAGLAVRKAAWVAATAQGGDGAPDATFAAIARSTAEGAAEQAAAAAHQVMGGYGFTIEEDCQLFSRRIRAWRLRLEPVRGELVELARRLLTAEGRDATRWLWHHEQGLGLPRWAAEADAGG